MKQTDKYRFKLQLAGDLMVDFFHYVALFVIGATIVYSAFMEYIHILETGHFGLHDILLLFIYIELGAMVGIYFKTHRLPVQYLVYIAITALSRHLVLDVQQVVTHEHMLLLLAITVAILILSLSILVLTFTGTKYGRPEDNVKEDAHEVQQNDPEHSKTK